MTIRNGSWCLLLAVTAALVVGTLAIAQINGSTSQQTADTAKDQTLIRSLNGVDLFRAYCASCHGKDGKGNGPAAAALKATVPDLTTIAKNNGGTFPEARVRRIIIGEGIIASHGSGEMPVWGPIFHQVEEDVDRGNVRLENLLRYLESVQVVHSPNAQPLNKQSSENVPSGEKLYKQNCAVCHGNDLKGNGPAPPPFKDVPPDLTTLARRNGGKFPEKYFADVLRNGVTLPAHGTPEMPTWGADFRTRDQLNTAQVEQRITNLTNYIKSLQAK
ncbi:MAG TPA: c-type cytochrome [Candidatus Acidoferrum sp.]|jgi:mono/diheme cytochrome c family protein